jgi:phosphatidylserine decarboxylase
MATVWHGIVNPPRTKNIVEWDYTKDNIVLKKGEEMGRFMLGSTVVLLFPHNTLVFNSSWTAAKPVRMGEAMGSRS